MDPLEDPTLVTMVINYLQSKSVEYAPIIVAQYNALWSVEMLPPEEEDSLLLKTIDSKKTPRSRRYKNFKILNRKYSDLEFIFVGFLKGVIIWSLPVFYQRSLKSLRRAFAIGTFVATFRAFNKLIKRLSTKYNFSYKDHPLFQKLMTSLGGCIAAFSLFTIDSSVIENKLVIFWLFVRALYTLVDNFFYMPFGTVIVQSLTVAIIIPNWIRSPQYVNRSYNSFLTWMAGIYKEDRVFANTRIKSTDHACFLIHPHLTCEQYIPVYFLDCAVRAARLYFPLHLFLFIWKRMPILSFASNLIKSILFLSSYVTICWSSTCYASKISPGLSASKISKFVWIAGLSLLLENPSRGIEITLYTSTYSLDILYTRFLESEAGQGFKLPRRFIVLLSIFVLFWSPKVLPNILTRWLLCLNVDRNKEKEILEKKANNVIERKRDSIKNLEDVDLSLPKIERNSII